jgi:adenine-specific DNA methylase
VDTESGNFMTKPKKLIEVAMPIKEISAESVRDKSIRHGHISTLHLWWARPPLPVCRAVVFASLVPDPLDENCPQAFRDAVEILLGSANIPLREREMLFDVYKPYDDIPYTAAIDKMEDNLRNRLLMFIGKYSKEYSDNEKVGKTTASGKQLSDYSLIKWDNKNNEAIINKARKLIWVSHNSSNGKSNLSAKDLLNDFEKRYQAIKDAEKELYSLPDRHIETENTKLKSHNLHNAIEAFLDKMPKVFDPFAGGGAIPLEASRLGCRSFGNDINPVAHIIQKGSLEFPQKYGKPITYSKKEFIKLYGQEEWNKITSDNLVYQSGQTITATISNRLSFDVEFYAKKLLAETEKEIGYLYPADGKGNKPIAYIWAKVGTCSNPICNAKVPLLKSFYLVNTDSKHVFLNPVITGKTINFIITEGKCDLEGWNQRANLKCPVCGSFTETKILKQQFFEKKTSETIIAVIEDSGNGKIYRLPTEAEKSILKKVPDSYIPSELLPQNDSQNLKITFWGFKTFGSMFSKRQLFALQTLVAKLNQIKSELDFFEEGYSKSIITYLGILIDRIVIKQNMFITWDTSRETISNLFGKQAIPMIFDYVEGYPFSHTSGSATNATEWIIRYIESESHYSFITISNNASSGDKSQFPNKYLTAVITDPPYYDAIAYADLSDFFYTWLKRILADIYPLNFATPQTPKTEECTALKHYHQNSKNEAKKHFEQKLTDIFYAIEFQTSDIVSIMFAHQSTEAWTTLCNSILGSKMNITGSWAIDTEMANRRLGLSGSVLASSVTVACIPAQREGFGEYKEVKKAIEKTVGKEVMELYQLGFRGADLLTACFGQAVSEFGKYEKVEKADGSEVTVAELLEMARESAFNALLKGFEGDDFTKFYIGWLQLYSLTESDFDDAAKFSRVGLSINVSELFSEHILIKNGNKQTLGTFEQRIHANKNLGQKATNYLIDMVHRTMALYKAGNRNALLQYIAKVAAQPENSFWRVVASLCEVLPAGSEDHKQAFGLLTNKDSLIRESKTVKGIEQEEMFK